jgi:hypothetical protein
MLSILLIVFGFLSEQEAKDSGVKVGKLTNAEKWNEFFGKGDANGK